MISHTAYFGDGVKTFTLTDPMIDELERSTSTGIGALSLRMSHNHFHIADIEQVIRLGLVGGMTSPVEAQRLVDTYAKNRPIDETLPLALDILNARWMGKPEAVEPAIWTNSQDDLRQAASTGDMSAAINESLKESVL